MTFFQRLLALFWPNPKREFIKSNLQYLKDERLQAQSLEAGLIKSGIYNPAPDSNADKRPDSIHAPAGCSWINRPLSLSRVASPDQMTGVSNGDFFGPDIQCFHDSANTAVNFQQHTSHTGAPYALECDIGDFDGNYLSIVHDLPSPAISGLTLEHIIRVELNVETTRDIKGYVRLNVQNGPNLAQLIARYRPGQEHATEFDLAYTKINEKRIEKAWIEIMFNSPKDTTFVIRDMICSRRRRAEF